MTKEEQLILGQAYTAKDHPIEEFRCVEVTKDSNHYHAASNLVAKGYLTTLFTENFLLSRIMVLSVGEHKVYPKY